MENMGKITRCKADDMPQYKRSGWTVVPHKAFANTDPAVLCEFNRIPKLDREDFIKYVENNTPNEV